LDIVEYGLRAVALELRSSGIPDSSVATDLSLIVKAPNYCIYRFTGETLRSQLSEISGLQIFIVVKLQYIDFHLYLYAATAVPMYVVHLLSQINSYH
jgi:hypothetical protein